MAIIEPNSTRRQALAGLAITAALGAAPVFAKTKVKSPPSSAAVALWRSVASDYQRTKAEYDVISARHDEQTAAYSLAVGEMPDFDAYGVNMRLGSRDRRIRDLQFEVAVKDYQGRNLTADDFADIARKAATLVDERDAWSAKSDEVFARTIATVEKDWEDALDRLCDAQNKLIETPAPDAKAMLEKIELLSTIMTEAGVEDATRMAAIKADAQRLLNAGRA